MAPTAWYQERLPGASPPPQPPARRKPRLYHMSNSQLIHDATQIICEGTCWVHWVLVGYLLGICWVLVGYILNEDFGEAPKSLNQAAATSCLYQFLHISTTKRALSLIVFLNTHQNSPPAALSTSHIYHWGFLYNRVTGSSLSK